MSYLATYPQTSSGSPHALAESGAHPLALRRQSAKARRVAVWHGTAVSLVVPVVLGLLVAFHQVVSGVVEQAALQRKTLAHHASETLRCKALPGQDARTHCLSQLFTQVAPYPAMPARLVVAGAQLAVQ